MAGSRQAAGAAAAQAPDRRKPATEAEQRRRLGAVEARVAELDKTPARDFPNYAALVQPEPLDIAAAQSQLRDDEVLLVLMDTPAWGPLPEETFIWAVAKSGARWVRSALGSKSLADSVAALRCGLDQTALGRRRVDAVRRPTRIPAWNASSGEPLPKILARAH